MSKSLHQMLLKLYSPRTYLKRRYPKAAKKRRIIKKWENRHPEWFRHTEYKRNPFLEMLKKGPESSGGYYPVPIIFGAPINE